jgi:two-component system sensor histidine kinase VicK
MELLNASTAIPVIQGTPGREIIAANFTDKTLRSADQLFTGEELEKIISSNEVGIWKYYLHTDRLEICPVAIRLLKLQSGAELNLNKVIRHLVGLQACLLVKALMTACHNKLRMEEVVRIHTGNDTPRWLKVTGDLYYYEGYACKMMGTITDLTELKCSQERGMDLMAFLNHELRTPLSIAKLYIQRSYLVAKEQKNDALEDMLMKADYQTVQMAAMIDNFLTLSRLEATSMVLQSSSFNLGKMILEMIADLQLIYPDRHFNTMQLMPVMVRADQDKIRQVLNNYLTNAIKYSPDHSTIHLAFIRHSNRVEVAVGDEGIGISPSDQKLLFDRYYRVHHTDTIRANGFGLGLFLSREIIEHHGGKVWVRSKPGVGSTFGFTLPY